MKKMFEEALAELVERYFDAHPNEIISALELQLMAFKEEHHVED